MLGELLQRGVSLAPSPEAADLMVVNTCAFIGPAKEESIEAILELVRQKESTGGRLIVAGCLAQRYGSELLDEIPEIDQIIGTGGVGEVARAASSLSMESSTEALPRLFTPPLGQGDGAFGTRVRSTRGGSAYLKIADGCDNRCAFCVIPSIRGPQRSRPIEYLIEEASALIDGGVRELNLIAQDLSAYGRDLEKKPHLADLLDQLSGLDGLRWIRMLYAYPRPMPPRFFDVWGSRENILPYLDIPLQHASDRMLRLMRRGPDTAFVRRHLEDIRSRLADSHRDLFVRTTFLVGHPGETVDDFKLLRDFLEEMRFERVGVFVYSDEEGTPAYEMDAKVPPEVAEERRAELMALQQNISAAHQMTLVGSRMEVLVEGASEKSDMVLQGRHAGQAPEVDGVVYLEQGCAAPGDMVDVEIHRAHEYDLVGRILRVTSKAAEPVGTLFDSELPLIRAGATLRVDPSKVGR